MAPLALRDWLVAERITVSFLPTLLAERVLALDWPQATAMRYLLTGGDALHHRPSPALLFTVVNNYGPSENTVVATSAPVAVVGEEPPPIGWPIANTVAHILDERLQPVAAGEVRELWIGAPVEATIALRGGAVSGAIEEVILTHDDIHAHNTFDAPKAVTLGAPRSITAHGASFTHTFAAQSVTRLTIPLG